MDEARSTEAVVSFVYLVPFGCKLVFSKFKAKQNPGRVRPGFLSKSDTELAAQFAPRPTRDSAQPGNHE